MYQDSGISEVLCGKINVIGIYKLMGIMHRNGALNCAGLTIQDVMPYMANVIWASTRGNYAQEWISN
jgi:hypothetical protein